MSNNSENNKCLVVNNEEGEKGLSVEIQHDECLNIYFGDLLHGGYDAFYEEISLDDARRIRDFLIYAIPE